MQTYLNANMQHIFDSSVLPFPSPMNSEHGPASWESMALPKYFKNIFEVSENLQKIVYEETVPCT
jgi:hypothetical protein